MIERKTLIRRLLFVAYFIAAFLLFLLILFPFDRLKSKIESEVRARTSLELSVGRISPRFLNWFVLSDVVLSDKSGTVLLESPSIKTTLSLFTLLGGSVSLELKAGAYGGELLVKAQEGKGRRYVKLDADGLDLGSYPLIKNLGVKLAGKLGGNFELSGDSGTSRLWIKGLASRELKIKGFPIPDMDFEQCWLDAELKGDRLTVKKFDLDGKELKIRVTGDVVLRERGTMNLLVKLKPSERLAHEQAGVLSLLKNKDAEGFYQFSLGGVLIDPMPRL